LSRGKENNGLLGRLLVQIILAGLRLRNWRLVNVLHLKVIIMWLRMRVGLALRVCEKMLIVVTDIWSFGRHQKPVLIVDIRFYNEFSSKIYHHLKSKHQDIDKIIHMKIKGKSRTRERYHKMLRLLACFH
jgi:hypothetical protein